ncbi:MAG: tetratricopeptide (TPR) repeat protein [Ascidiaceihabitans sp.]|jgi:tetratricopeptide (TPR) repeat protein
MTYHADMQAAAQFLHQGTYKRALKAAQSAAKKSPRSAMAFNVIGIATSSMGHPKAAIAPFQKALSLQPDFPDAQKNLAQTLILIGRAQAAVALLVTLTDTTTGTTGGTTPDDWKVWYLKAQGELALGLEAAALTSLDTARALAPNTTAIYHLRSTVFLALGQIKDAIADLQAVLAITPDDVRALTNLSLPLARQTRSQDALDVVQKAVDLAPDDIPARYRLATQHVEMGDTAAAILNFSAILDIQRDNAAALEQLATLSPKDDAPALEPRIRSALNKAGKRTEDRASLFFALSSVLRANDNTAEAQKMLARANAEMAAIRPYDPVADTQVTQAILDRFPMPPTITTNPTPACTPIFVIGLPRSGTTLVETVLGLHTSVAPLGERGTMGFLLRRIIENDLPFTAQDAADLVHQDQRLLPDLPAGTTAYVDKMPENYRLVGFLKQAYPNARIINVRRDPRDIALSMWTSHFAGSALSYANRWDWMATKFNLYARSMEHWNRHLGNQILNIRYEDLVRDVKGIGKHMAAFCEIDWQDKMARPDRATTPILTLSATQIRRPVHTGSIGKWRASADLLAPFIAGLDQALWRTDLDQPPA